MQLIETLTRADLNLVAAVTQEDSPIMTAFNSLTNEDKKKVNGAAHHPITSPFDAEEIDGVIYFSDHIGNQYTIHGNELVKVSTLPHKYFQDKVTDIKEETSIATKWLMECEMKAHDFILKDKIELPKNLHYNYISANGKYLNVVDKETGTYQVILVKKEKKSYKGGLFQGLKKGWLVSDISKCESKIEIKYRTKDFNFSTWVSHNDGVITGKINSSIDKQNNYYEQLTEIIKDFNTDEL